MTLSEKKEKIYIHCHSNPFMDVRNTIVEALLNRNKIQTKEEILKLVEDYKKKFNIRPNKDIIKYLSRHNYTRKIFKSYYYINSFDERIRGFCNLKDYEVIFTVLNKMDLMWYAGMNYSLYLQGKAWQTPNQISIVNTKFNGTKKIFGLKVRFFKLNKNFFFGLKDKKTPNGVNFLLSDPAKTYIDMVYFKQSKQLTRVKNTQKYLKRYPKWLGTR